MQVQPIQLDSLGNGLWHTDESYMPTPVVLGLLHAKTLPPTSPFGNGETEFADMPARIADLVVEHDVFWSRGQMGFTNFEPGEREQYPPSPQRLLRTYACRGKATWSSGTTAAPCIAAAPTMRCSRRRIGAPRLQAMR